MKTVIFTDFDGTISRHDVGYSLFHHFSNGKNDALLPAWKSGEMSSREILIREAKMVTATPEELYAFVDTIPIDLYFPEFVSLCENQDLELTVVSDGLDFYIKHLLSKYNLDRLNYVTNKAVLENNTITVEFPHTNKSCTRCGICKGELITARKEADPNIQTVFIGDGYSDVCAAHEADILFAKKDLKAYCLEKNIPYTTYDTFADVIRELRKIAVLK